MNISDNINYFEQKPTDDFQQAYPKKALKSLIRPLINRADAVKVFFGSTKLAKDVRKVAFKVNAEASNFFQNVVKSTIDNLPIPIELRGMSTAAGKALFSFHFISAFAVAVGGVLNVVNLVKAGRMMREGKEMVANRKTAPAHPVRRGYWEYGKNLVKTGKRQLILQSSALAASALGLMQTASEMASMVHPATAAATTVVYQVGTVVAAPITFCLSAYGAKVNIERIRGTSVQLTLLREELNRLEARKMTLGVNRFTTETETVDGREVNLKEREEIIRFALRRIGDKRVNHIVSLVMNSLFMAASVFAVGSIATGPAGAVFGSLTIVCAVAGGGGALVTRGILTALRHRRKMKQKREMGYAEAGPWYISSKQMLAKAEKILSTDQTKGVRYQEKPTVPSMSNGELLAFLLRGTSTRLNLEDTRSAFLVGEKHYWRQAFA